MIGGSKDDGAQPLRISTVSGERHLLESKLGYSDTFSLGTATTLTYNRRKTLCKCNSLNYTALSEASERIESVVFMFAENGNGRISVTESYSCCLIFQMSSRRPNSSVYRVVILIGLRDRRRLRTYSARPAVVSAMTD